MRFAHPSTLLLAGPSQAGKSRFVKRIIESDVFSPKPEKIIYCYSVWTEGYRDLPKNVKLVQGLPDKNAIKNSLVVMDDLMSEIDKSVSDLFTKNSHHCNCSVIFIVQNLFHQSKLMRTISLNSHYIVLFKNPRDSSQIMHLARQVAPTNTRYITEAFKDATSRAYGYLLLDLRQETPDELRVRTNVLDTPEVVYLPKKDERSRVSESSNESQDETAQERDTTEVP